MDAQDKKDGMTLTLVEAVETLSNIADLQFDRNLGIAEQHDLIVQDRSLIYHTVHWLHHQDADETVSIVKETFRVILKYLQNFYKNDYSYISDPQALEGIKTIMVLVGEAAKKLDKYTALFLKTQAESVTELKEYKKLQEFYLSRIARKIDEGTLGKWILGLSQRSAPVKKVSLEGKERVLTKHVFIDLESVKKDTEYELFFLRKEDGTRFFSPRLIRNIKLVSDFGDYIGEQKREDPLLSISVWEDRAAYHFAKSLIWSTKGTVEKYFQLVAHTSDQELVETLNKCLLGLMMAANTHNLTHNIPIKNCRDYFHDFQLYLRQCLLSRDYQRMMAYPPAKSSKLANGILKVIHSLCLAIYSQVTSSQDYLGLVHGLIQQAGQDLASDHKRAVVISGTLSGKLAGEYVALLKLLKMHPNGPLNKILNTLEEGDYRCFDPLIQDNLPSVLYSLYVKDSKCVFMRWPSPTHQEFINKACVNEEFKAFLYACEGEHHNNKCLLINFQDRVNWKEHSRAVAVEDLSKHDTFSKAVQVVTLSKDTEFYHQLAPYHQENRAALFLKHFKDQLYDDNCGFYFPQGMKKEMIMGFADDAMKAIHQIFFSGKNMLLREHRMDFIEIFYLFLELKIVDYLKPNIVGFSCKDGLDITSTASAELFIFLKLLNQERLSESDRELVDLMIYGPCLLVRQRIIMVERFNRMLSAVKCIEATRDQLGYEAFNKLIQSSFGKLYKAPILKGKVTS